MRSNGLGSRVYIPTCLPVAHDEDGGSLLIVIPLCCFETLFNELALEAMQFVRIFYSYPMDLIVVDWMLLQ